MRSRPATFIPLVLALFLLTLLIAGCADLRQTDSSSLIPTATSTPIPTATIIWFPETATPTLFVAPTPQPTENQLEGIGPLVLSDSFQDTTSWQVGEKPSGSVEYSIDRLTLAVHQSQGTVLSFRTEPTITNAYVEITTSISLCAGNDSYGLLFRASSNLDFYRLAVNCNGLVRLDRVRNGVVNALVDWTISSQLSAGAPLTLRLGVLMNGRTFRVFINKEFQFEAHDDIFALGTLGVFAHSAGKTSVTVNFSDLQVFDLLSEASTTTGTPVVTP